MEVELLEQIVKNTAHKTSFQIILSNDKSNFNTAYLKLVLKCALLLERKITREGLSRLVYF